MTATETIQGHAVAAYRVLLKFKTAPTASALAAVGKETSANYLEPIGGAGWYLLRSPDVAATQLITALEADANVAQVEPDYVGQTIPNVPESEDTITPADLIDMPNDPFFSSQWGLYNDGQCFGSTCGTAGDDVNVMPAWGITHGASDVVTADFDTGIDYNNPDLTANIWSAPSAYSIYEGGNTYDCPAGSHGIDVIDGQSGCAGQEIDTYGHGTETAGVADAVTNNGIGVAGVAWNVPMISIKMCTSGPNGCDAATAITAIDAALQIEADFGLRIVAGNMSVQGLAGSALEDEMILAGQSGMFLSVSTGDDCESTAEYPAAFYLADEIAVSASDQKNNPAVWGVGSCSNGGGDIAAPGNNVYTTAMGDDGLDPENFTGTSASAPFVTGATALLESECHLDPIGIKATLEGTASQIPSLDSVATDGRLLNVGNALASCATGAPATATVTITGDGCPTCKSSAHYRTSSGTASVTIDGMPYSTNWSGVTSTSLTVANGLAGQMNGFYFTTQVSGTASDATITITANANGLYTNDYTFTVDSTNNCHSSETVECQDDPFDITGSGTFSGGHS